MWGKGLSSTAATTSATSRTATGDVRPEPNGRRIVPSLAIEDAAHAEKKKCSRNTVGRTCIGDMEVLHRVQMDIIQMLRILCFMDRVLPSAALQGAGSDPRDERQHHHFPHRPAGSYR